MDTSFDFDIDIFDIDDIEADDTELVIGDIDDDLSLDDLEFDSFDEDIVESEAEIAEEDNIDYSLLITNLAAPLAHSQRTIQNSITHTQVNFDLPFDRKDFEILTDVQFHVYSDFMQDTVTDCISSNTVMPPCSELCEIFLQICADTGWFFGLQKDSFVQSFAANYKCVLDELNSYRARMVKLKKSLFAEEDIAAVRETAAAIEAITAFPNVCARFLKELSTVDLERNIHHNAETLGMFRIAGRQLHTIADLMDATQEILKSQYVHDLLLREMNADVSMVSIEEIIRLLFVHDVRNISFIVELQSVTGEVDYSQAIFSLMQKRLENNDEDVFAFLILAVFLIITVGTVASTQNDIIKKMDDFSTAYKETALAIHNNEHYKMPAFITEVSFRDDKTYIGCSKGAENVLLETPFYLVEGTSTSMIKAPVSSFCHCEHRNCKGCLFPPNIFISQMMEWTEQGTLDSKKQNNTIRYRAILTPKELSKLQLTVNLDDTETNTYNVSQETEKWFFSFQNYIKDFTFKDDGYEPSIFSFVYKGAITEDMSIPDLLPGDEVDVQVYGIELFHSKGNNEYSLIRFHLNGAEIDNGTLAVDEEKVYLSYFTKDSYDKQYIELPRSIAELHTPEAVESEDTVELNVYKYIQNDDIVPLAPQDGYKRYKRIAYILSDLTGNAFDFLEEISKQRLVSSFWYLLSMSDLQDRMLQLALYSYRDWLQNKEYESDIVNFSVLKSLLSALQGKDNILSKCEKGSDITDEIVQHLLRLGTEKIDVTDMLEKWNSLDQDLLANIVVTLNIEVKPEQYAVFEALLGIPELRDFLLTLQYKMLISIICQDSATRLPLLFSGIPSVAKIFKSKTVEAIGGVHDKICKNLKKYRKINILPVTTQILGTKRNALSENYSVLRAYALSESVYGMLNVLVALDKKDLVSMILSELKVPKEITPDYFETLQNEMKFSTVMDKLDLSVLFTTCLEQLLPFIYEGFKQDIITHNSVFAVLAYDILTNVYDDLYLDFDFDESVLEQDYDTAFFTMLSSVLVTYSYVTGEAVFDSNEGRDRVLAYKNTPECFPIMSGLEMCTGTKDLLYIGSD